MAGEAGGLIALAIAAAIAAPASSTQSVQAMAGRYHERVRILDGNENAFVGNVAEIVPVGPRAAYFRVRLVFNYDHVCELWGVAAFESGALIFDDPESSTNGMPHCRMMLRHVGDALLVTDPQQSCNANCGGAVTFNGARLPWKSRRPITYLGRLKASEQYRQSLLAWQNRKSGS